MTMLDGRPSEIPTIDPRIRQRWIEARRAEGRRRLRVLVVFLSVVAVISGAIAVVYSPIVKVRHVRISLPVLPAGSELSAAQVRAQAGLDRERLMVHISTPTETALVDELPWVASARVRREWPATIRITVTVRRPVAVTDRVPGHPADGLAVLDRSGRVLALVPSGTTAPASAAGESGTGGGSGGTPAATPGLVQVAAGLPALGDLPAAGAPGTWLGGSERLAPQAAAELATAAALTPDLRTRVTSIGEGPDGLTLLVGRISFAFGGTTQLPEKVAALETVLDDVSVGQYSLVDLRVPDRPALTPRQSGH